MSFPLKETVGRDSSDDLAVKPLLIPPGEEAPKSQQVYVAKVHKSWG